MASLRIALGEIREHAIIYGTIVLIIALAMTVFTTQNAIQEYQDYVNTKSIGIVYGDYAVTAPGVTARQLLARAPTFEGADAIIDAIERNPGYRAAQRGSVDASVYVAAFKGEPCDRAANYTADAGAFWGVDLGKPDVGDLRPHIVAGSWFDPTADYSQAGLGAPAGTTHQGKPTVTGYNPPCVDFASHYAPRGSPGYQAPYPVVIGKSTAALHDLEIGDVLLTNMFTTADRGTFGTPYFEVIGIYEVGQPKFEELNYFVPLQSLKEFKEWGEDEINVIAIEVPEGASEREVLSVLERAAPANDVQTTKTLKSLWIGNLGDVAELLLVTTVSAALILAATAVKFVMDSVLVRKTREIGTLKALGATDRQVVGIFLWQAGLLGLAAAALGFGLAHVVMAIVERVGVRVEYVLGTEIEIRFLVTPLAALLAFALPIVVALGAAIVPAWRAARLAPVEAMRRGSLGTRRLRLESKSRRVTTGRLARMELRDNAAVYAVVALAVAVALATYGLQAAFQNNLREQVRVGVQDTISGDAMILAEGSSLRHAFAGARGMPDAAETAARVEAAGGYRAVLRTMLEGLVFFDNATVDGGQDVDAGAFVGISPTDEAVLALREKVVAGSYFDPGADYSQAEKAQAQREAPLWFPSVFPQPRLLLNESYPEYPVLVGRASADSHGLHLGDKFTAVFNSPTSDNAGRRVFASFTILGFYESGLPFNDLLVYYVPLVAANELRGFGPGEASAVVVKADGDRDPSAISASLARLAPGLAVFSWHDMTVYFTGGLFDAMSLITTAAILITITLAGVAILYAMDASVKRKTKEIGILKALGATDARIVGIFLRQGLVIGVASGLLALAALRAAVAVLLAIGLSAELPLGARQKLGFLLTPEILAVVTLVPIGVAFVASLVPAYRAARLPPVEALREGELSL